MSETEERRRFPTVYVLDYMHGQEDAGKVWGFREEIAELLLETHKEIEDIRLISNGGGAKILFEITVAAGEQATRYENTIWNFLRVEEAEAKLEEAERNLTRVKSRAGLL